jgi:hypothetical protein
VTFPLPFLLNLEFEFHIPASLLRTPFDLSERDLVMVPTSVTTERSKAKCDALKNGRKVAIKRASPCVDLHDAMDMDKRGFSISSYNAEASLFE